MRSSLALAACIAACASPGIQAQSYDVHFATGTLAGTAGSVVTVPVEIQNGPLAVTGFSFGIRHDASKLTLESMDIGAALAAVLPGSTPDDRFLSVNTSPAGGPGVTVAMILSADNASVSLPAGNHRIFDAKYRLAGTGTGDAIVALAGDMGTPPVPIILDLNGVAQAPTATTTPKTVTITFSGGPAPFERGDIDQDGRPSVSDAILIFDFLFGGALFPNGQNTYTSCQHALNFDATTGNGAAGVEDLADVTITDAIFFLDYLFQQGTPPPGPVGTCGQPDLPASPEFACTAFTCN
jgi:hypothetical protein